jgi:hypothetical protein
MAVAAIEQNSCPCAGPAIASTTTECYDYAIEIPCFRSPKPNRKSGARQCPELSANGLTL